MLGKSGLVVLVLVFEAAALQRAERGGPRVSRARHEAHGNASMVCDTNQINYRLTRLEVQSAEKSEMLNSEMRETNRRLQALEWQTSDVHTALEEFRNQLARYTEVNQPERQHSYIPDNLELKIDNMAKGLQLVVAAVRGLRVDIGNLRKNISAVAQSTKALSLSHENLVTKPFLTDSLVDVKHHHLSQHLPTTSRHAKDFPENCKEVQERGNNVSGIYRIQPELAPRAFMAVCDMDTSGGGWTYIHNRHEGVQDFYLNWHNYKLGFGNLGGEFWIGLDYLHQLTGYEVNELLVELEDVEGRKVYAHYGAFSVGSEGEGYPLKVLSAYSGDAGDSLQYHAGSKFSTKDVDQDGWVEGSCAQAHTGAWWYKSCDNSNLNGRYMKGQVPDNYLYQGMYWGEFHGAQYSLLRARMMIRPHSKNRALLSNEEDVF